MINVVSGKGKNKEESKDPAEIRTLTERKRMFRNQQSEVACSYEMK
jgi:hypothetical protein